MTPHGLAAAHVRLSLALSGRHGLDFVLDGLPHQRAKALEHVALELHEPGDLGRQDRSWGRWRGEMLLGDPRRVALEGRLASLAASGAAGSGATRTRATKLRTVARILSGSDPGDAARSSGPLEALRRRSVVAGLRRDLPQLQQAPIDGRDVLDGLPPALVVADPEPDGAGQVPGHSDLLGAPSREGHADAQDRVAGSLGAATGGLAAADLALEEAAAQHFLQRRQRLGDLGSAAPEGWPAEGVAWLCVFQ